VPHVQEIVFAFRSSRLNRCTDPSLLLNDVSTERSEPDVAATGTATGAEPDVVPPPMPGPGIQPPPSPETPQPIGPDIPPVAPPGPRDMPPSVA
jgi:hypothetical protein